MLHLVRWLGLAFYVQLGLSRDFSHLYVLYVSQASWLKSQGIKKGDCVAVYMPMVVELPIAMLACARIGAVHSVVFGGFSAEALSGEQRNVGQATSNQLAACSLT